MTRMMMTVDVTLRTTAMLTVVAALATGCGRAPAPEAKPEAATPASSVALSADALKAAGIELTTVRMMDRRDPVQATGIVTLDERRTARPGAILEGIVANVRVQPGDAVARGAVLASIHSHVVHDAWAAWFTALAERRRQEHALGFARDAEARATRLLAEKALAPQDVERAVADRVAAEQALVMARAEVTRAGQELEHYGITPGEDADPRAQDAVPVTTAIGGTVVDRLVSPGAAVTTGTPLFVVSDLAAVWVIAQVDERHAGRLARGGAARVSVSAYPGETFDGTIDAVGDTVDAATRRVTVRITVPNQDRRLKIDMFATVALGDAAPRAVLAVPSGAVQQMEGETVVFIRRADGRFHRQAIHAGPDADGWVEVIDGVAEGDEVVSAGAFLLKSELLGTGDEEH